MAKHPHQVCPCLAFWRGEHKVQQHRAGFQSPICVRSSPFLLTISLGSCSMSWKVLVTKDSNATAKSSGSSPVLSLYPLYCSLSCCCCLFFFFNMQVAMKNLLMKYLLRSLLWARLITYLCLSLASHILNTHLLSV